MYQINAVRKANSTIRKDIILQKLNLYLIENGCSKNIYYEEDFRGSELEDDIESMRIYEIEKKNVCNDDSEYKIFILKLNRGDEDNIEVDEEEVIATQS